jgi:Zn-dependent oligopeptidase
MAEHDEPFWNIRFDDPPAGKLTPDDIRGAMDEMRRRSEERVERIRRNLEVFEEAVHPLMKDDEIVRVMRSCIANEVFVSPAQHQRMREEYMRRLNAKLAESQTPLEAHLSDERAVKARWN